MRSLFLFITVAIISCQSIGQKEKPATDLLLNYSQQSFRTDPGKYIDMYVGLPHSLDSLNSLIKCLLLHPLEARQLGIEMEELSNDGITPTAEKLLEQLVIKGHTELECPVEIKNRLIVACYHHTMLLTSILRDQGIPVRMRAGFSRFFEKEYGVRFGHIICEVWDSEKEEWLMVDPDRGITGMSKSDFDFAYQAWENVRNGKKEAGIYTASIADGIKGIINLLILDASLIIKDEKLYWELPEIVLQDMDQISDLDPAVLSTLDELADCCSSPDGMFREIFNIYDNTRAFRPSKMTYESYFEVIMSRRQ